METDLSIKGMFSMVENDGIEYSLHEDTKTASIIKALKSNIFIPKSIIFNSQEYIVTDFLNTYFRSQCIVKSIEFAANSEMKKINKKTFCFCYPVETLTFNSNDVEFKDGCFKNTRSLKKINIMPDHKQYSAFNDEFIIGKSSLERDNFDYIVFASRDIEKAKIPSFIEKIGPYAFDQCQKLQFVDIPHDSQLQIIDKCAFSNSLIESLSIPEKLVELKNGWCKGMSHLKNITIHPNNHFYSLYNEKLIIGKSSPEKESFDVLVFASRDIEKVEIPSFIEIIAPYAFDQCQKLRFVDIPFDSKLRIIDKYAFSNSSIESITIPSQVKKIGKYAFFQCSQLRDVQIPPNSKLQKIEKLTFSKTSLESFSVPNHVTGIDKLAFKGCLQLQHIEISSNSELRIIEEDSFCDTIIESLSLPPKLEELKKGWCNGTSQLKKINIMPNNKRYSIYNDKFIIGKSSIEKDDFDVLVFASRDIKKVVIPSFIEIIGAYAFMDCISLSCVDIPHDSKLRIIDKYAFFKSSIIRITIPPQVKSINKGAFSNCQNLRHVEIPSNSELNKIGESAFDHSSIERLFIPSNITRFRSYSFKYCPNLKYIDFANDSQLQTIEHSVFWCSSIESISIPRHVKYILPYAFSRCTELQTVEFEGNIEMININDLAFNNCKNIVLINDE